MANQSNKDLPRNTNELLAIMVSGENPDESSASVSVSLPAGPTTATNASVATSGSSSTALAANPNRKYYCITNPSSNTDNVWLSYEDTAVVGAGIELVPGEKHENWGDVFTGAIKVIAASGTPSVAVVEV